MIYDMFLFLSNIRNTAGLYLVMLLGILVFVTDAAASTQDKDILSSIETCYDHSQYDSVKEKAEELVSLSLNSGDMRNQTIGECYYLMAAIMKGDRMDYDEPIKSLEKRMEKFVKSGDDDVLAYIWKVFALYYQNIETDYPRSVSYSFKMLDYARKEGEKLQEIDALNFLASVYFMRGDTSGLAYAREAYELSKELEHNVGLYISGCNVCNYLYNKGQIEEALDYMKEAFDMAVRLDRRNEFQYLYSFMGDIYARMEENELAEAYYRKSVIDLPETSNYDKLYSRICYSQFLMKMERYQEAIAMLKYVEQQMGKYDIPTFRKEVYFYISAIYESLGQYGDALSYYKRFVEVRDEILSNEREKAFKELDFKYQVSEEKKKNAMQQVEIMEKNRKLTLMLFVVIISVGFILVLSLIYRYKTKQYKDIVRANIDKIENEKRLRMQLEEMINNSSKDVSEETKEKAEGKYNRSSLSEEKSRQLFILCEELMYREKVYHDQSMTIDKLAGMLNTNRTYLSQVINEQSGKSYSDYVNSYRIDEAVKKLSDPSCDEQIKAISYEIGFSSPQTFYALFKAKVGISPSSYRDSVKKMSNDI